jgi:hypothetical protein
VQQGFRKLGIDHRGLTMYPRELLAELRVIEILDAFGLSRCHSHNQVRRTLGRLRHDRGALVAKHEASVEELVGMIHRVRAAESSRPQPAPAGPEQLPEAVALVQRIRIG